MTYITRKKKNGRYYLYLMEDARINGKKKHILQKYIGPEDRLKDLKLSKLFSKHSAHVQVRSLSFGISAALWQIAQNINLIDTIDTIIPKSRHQGLSTGELLTIAAINRCSAPCSKSKLEKWFKRDWLSTQFEINPSYLNAQTYWNHFQSLNEEIINQLETSINKAILAKYNLELDHLLFDPTNFFTFSKTQDSASLLQFGHSKENRNGNKLVSYSLLCARDSGVPIMHETYAGNIQDAKAFKQVPINIQNRLTQLGYTPAQITLVFDKGNHSKEAFHAINEANFGFIVSARNSSYKKLLQLPEDQFTEIMLPVSNKLVKYYKCSRKIYGKRRDLYVVWDPKKQKKHTHHFETQLAEKLLDIEEFFQERLNIKKWRDKEAVAKKLKALIGRNPFKSIIEYKIHGNYADLTYSLSINELAKQNHIKTLGKSILFTNRNDWSARSIIWGYREQYVVEHAFKTMKSPSSIAIRPMYHYTERSIRAHVFICVLSLLLLSLLRYNLSQNSIPLSYGEILEEFDFIRLLEIKFTSQGKLLWKLEKREKMAQKLCRTLELERLIPR